MGQVEYHPGADHESEEGVLRHRAALAAVYAALPGYGSPAFWRAIEEPDTQKALTLEVLVRCVRAAVAQGDNQGRNRIIEIIFRRIQETNDYWVNNLLRMVPFQAYERTALISDLYADLYERVIRALIDPHRLFWEENFLHCLRFEHKHVYQAFMVHEGRRKYQHTKQSERIPRILLQSLDQPRHQADGETWELEIEDERAQQALRAVEHADLPQLILHLPEKLKSVILLIFWEGRTEKDTAQILGITDRTVRNRLRDALNILRNELDPGREGVYG